jgi:YVTN family beta-propeller protein
MRTRTAVTTVAAAAMLAAWAAAHPSAADGPYQKIKEIAIPGEGGWDYLTVDPAAHRLYVSHSSRVVVIDTTTDQIVGEIADTPGVHGAVPAGPDRVFTSNGRGNTASIVDAKTLQTLGKVETGGNPDFIMYDPRQKEVYTFNGSGKSATVIDTASGKVVATIPLGGKPEAAVTDGAGRVFVNIEDKDTIAVIDTAKHEVTATWPIAPGGEAAGLALDPKTHRLFIGAHKPEPPLMLMMDAANGKIVAQVPIGMGVDATWFDPGTGYAFSSCGDGTTTIAHEDSPSKLTVVQTLKTTRGARTMALDPTTHRIYLAAAKYEPPAPDAPPNARPRMIPGSMHLLVYGIDGK